MDNSADMTDILRHHNGKSWCLAMIRPRNEKFACTQLGNLGVIGYLPLITKVTIHNRSKRETRLPMFPGYLFLCADQEEQTAIRCNKAVRQLSVLDEYEEESLLADLRQVRRCELESARRELVVNPGLQVGDVVQVKSGAFRGERAVVIRREDALRIVINLNFLGRNIEMLWNADDLEK